MYRNSISDAKELSIKFLEHITEARVGSTPKVPKGIIKIPVYKDYKSISMDDYNTISMDDIADDVGNDYEDNFMSRKLELIKRASTNIRSSNLYFSSNNIN